MNGDICLVYPPYYNAAVHVVPPIGILRLAAYLLSQGRKVRIEDLVLELAQGKLPLDDTLPARCSEAILKGSPAYVGISVQALTLSTSISIAEHIKRLSPTTKIVFGGYGVSFESARYLDITSSIDAIVIGEGEITLHELLTCWDEGQPIGHVKGLAYKPYRGLPALLTANREQITNLDDLPFPAYHLIEPLDRYGTASQGKASYNQPFPIDAGRGCSFTCTFCSSCLMFARTVRVRSPENIIEELNHLKERSGVRHFLMTYDLFDFDKDYVKDFCRKMISNSKDIIWECRCRIEMLDIDTIELMYLAGCRHVLFGIESGSKRTLKAIKKTTNLGRMKARIEAVVKGGLVPIFSFVVGFPEEQPEDVDQTLSLGLYCKLVGNSYINLHLPTALPGTDLWKQSKHLLVLANMTGDMSSGVSFSAGSGLLTDDLDRIKRFPDLFSTFYNIDPPALGIETVFFLHRVWPALTSMFGASIYTYAKHRTGSPIWLLVKDFRDALEPHENTTMSDFNKPIDISIVLLAFSRFMRMRLIREGAQKMPESSILEWEIARAAARMSLPRDPNIDCQELLSWVEQRMKVLREDVQVVRLRYDLSDDLVLEDKLLPNEHFRIMVPSAKYDFDELEVPGALWGLARRHDSLPPDEHRLITELTAELAGALEDLGAFVFNVQAEIDLQRSGRGAPALVELRSPC